MTIDQFIRSTLEKHLKKTTYYAILNLYFNSSFVGPPRSKFYGEKICPNVENLVTVTNNVVFDP